MRHLAGIIAGGDKGSRIHPAFFDRAGARIGFSILFGS